MRNFIFSPLALLSLLFLPSWVSAQNISGKVVDENGMSMPGVGVTLVSSTTGSITDMDGNFSIAAKPGDQLQFSFVGYQTISVSALAGMSVSMKPSTTDLSEVVVIGYGTQRKADVTGSIAVVSEKELRDRPNANAISSIQGKVAGVVINNSGKPGDAPGISIRGLGSIAGTDVLYVVDGVLTNNITYLNPSDVESMSVLKDASSAAIYGLRAANGVIVITTKLGRKGGEEKIKFSYDTNVGFSKPTNVLDLAGSEDYVRLYNQKLIFEGNTNPADQIALADFNGVDTDWYDEILKKSSFTQSHNVGMTGASEKTRYSVGLGYFTQEGILDANKGVSSGDDYKRVTARFNGIYDVTSKFRVGVNMAYYKFDSNDAASPFYQARVALPVVPVLNADGSYGTQSTLGTAGNINPRYTLDIFRGKTKGTRTLMSGFAEYDIIKGLTYKMNYSRDYTSVDNYQYTAENTGLGTGIVNPSKLTNRHDTFESILWENTLNWTKEIGKNRITVLAGYSRQQDRSLALRGSAQDVPFNGDDSTLYLNLGTPVTIEFPDGEEGNKSRLQSYFGRFQYAFDDKYLLNATVRRDGSSAYNFSGDQRSATFPSVGLGWVVSKESFMNNSGVDFLKLKASWGKLGNATVPRQFDEVASSQPGAFFGTPSTLANAVSVTQLVDPTINWEIVEETDFGVEARILKNRLSLEAGYYNRETKDAVFDITIPPLSGLGTRVFTNAGSFVNKGFEFTANWSDKTSEKFSYAIYGNVTTIDNEITEVLGGSFFNTGPGLFGNPIKRWEQGQDVGSYYGFEVEGVNQTTGALEFKDLDGNGAIDDQDKTFLGSPIPELVYGFGFSMNYSNIDLSVDFQGVAGNEIYNFNRNARFGNENWDQDFADNSWTPTNSSNTYPVANSDQTSSRPSSFYVEKGDYFRVRNIQIGYTLPSSLLSKAKLDRVRFYISAQNPFTSFNYNGFSPELGKQSISDSGIDNNVYPLSGIYSFGINLNF
ncbi:MAG: SusC/RagA family TonB-linked outer membrane protein [Flavobacterium sp. BFFFF1]|uniref:SusC/RagA family TonB-linked outer membrane protein n=1 Tax=Flavobacterium sp. BFFFF1 TaxID=2015557 RepID=UPI000BD01D25|nr:TonB-dependent receptor [Flavobacterium sp. BFFFF1]OYU80292.1 MAG: SusC/RagA family TonB-linked outer membrane protein [Flavobacterium sp. BFFFF1]